MGLYDPSPIPVAPAEGAEAAAINSASFEFKQLGLLVGNGVRTVFTMELRIDPSQSVAEPEARVRSTQKLVATQPTWTFEAGGILKIAFAAAPGAGEEILIVVRQ